MHCLSTVMEIDRLLKEGYLSQREIAKKLHVSRGTVGAIANGRRPLIGKDPRDGRGRTQKDRGRAQRCPKCGHHVFLPCQICLANEFVSSQEDQPSPLARQRARRESPRNSRLFHAETPIERTSLQR
jgi:hypothetical protein